MTSVARRDFIQQLQSTPLAVADLRQAARLADVDVAKADANRDGVIAGPQELGALWNGISGSTVAPTTQERAGLFPWSKPRTTSTPAGERLAAVESFRLQALRMQEAAARGDVYGREGVVEGGPARGEPVDSTKARPVQLLDAAAKAEACRKAGVDPATIEHAFANLRHDGAFHIALVPRGAVEHLSVLQENFPAPVPAAHAMLRFQLRDDRPAILVPQTNEPNPKTQALPDLVFSAEALGQPGWRYDLVAGQKGNFQLVDRMESLEDRFRHVESYNPPHPVHVHRVNVSSAVANQVLAEALATSERRGFADQYSTIERSCGTEAFGILDRGVGHNVPLHVHLARAITGERLPTHAHQYLRLRGLVDRDDRPTLLADEMRAAPRVATPRPAV
jgi:hypothetical protein